MPCVGMHIFAVAG